MHERLTYVLNFLNFVFGNVLTAKAELGGNVHVHVSTENFMRLARVALCVVNSNGDGTGGKGRGEVRGAESKSYIRYSTRLDSSQASVAVFLLDSLFFLHRIAHCALHTVMYGLGRPSSQDEDQAESGYICTYVCSLPFAHVRV